MTSMIRSAIAAGLLAGAFAVATPQDAVAQGKSDKTSKVEKKTTRQVSKTNRTARKTTVRNTSRTSTTYRRAILCEDGTLVRLSISCAGHGGVAARQGPAGGYPPASDRARERANENSAVIRGTGSSRVWSGANNVRSGAIARCADGTYWHSTTRDGACYGHGGVAVWY